MLNQRDYNPKSYNVHKSKRDEGAYVRDSDDNNDEDEVKNDRYRSRKSYERPRQREYYSREKPERDENVDRTNYNSKYNFKYDKERSFENNYDEDNNIQKRSHEVLSNNYYNNTYGDDNPNRYNSRMNEMDRKNYINSSVDNRLDEFDDRNRFNYKVNFKEFFYFKMINF